jgi:type VI secretion system Hcp family effector
MPIHLSIPGPPTVPCRRFEHRVHAEITKDRRATDPRVPGRSRHEDLQITREVDALTPFLCGACASGARIEAVQLDIERHLQDDAPDGPPDAAADRAPVLADRHLRIRLEDVLVTSALLSQDGGPPLETVSLSYGTIHWEWITETTTRATWAVYGPGA